LKPQTAKAIPITAGESIIYGRKMPSQIMASILLVILNRYKQQQAIPPDRERLPDVGAMGSGAQSARIFKQGFSKESEI